MMHDDKGFSVSCEYFEQLVGTAELFKDVIIQTDSIYKEASLLIPFDIGPKIYFLLNDGVIVYIGKTDSMSRRIADHLDVKIFNKVATFKINKTDLSMIEAVNIKHYAPHYNQDVWNDERYFNEIVKRS